MFNLFGKKKAKEKVKEASPKVFSSEELHKHFEEIRVETDISEPVLTISKLIIEDRERFNIEELESYYSILDKKTNKSFTIAWCGVMLHHRVSDCCWMTNKEARYLAKIVIDILLKEKAEKAFTKRQQEKYEWLDAYKDDM